ncbi:MAG: molybdopterin cofactor-binding domain-containing protein [Burkholderiales bacterium]
MRWYVPQRQMFVIGSAAAGGGLALGFQIPFGLDAGIGTANAAVAAAPGSEINAWVVVKPDDTCVIRIARSEMGQGTLTGLAQLVAEELEWQRNTLIFRNRHEGCLRKTADYVREER